MTQNENEILAQADELNKRYGAYKLNALPLASVIELSRFIKNFIDTDEHILEVHWELLEEINRLLPEQLQVNMYHETPLVYHKHAGMTLDQVREWRESEDYHREKHYYESLEPTHLAEWRGWRVSDKFLCKLVEDSEKPFTLVAIENKPCCERADGTFYRSSLLHFYFIVDENPFKNYYFFIDDITSITQEKFLS